VLLFAIVAQCGKPRVTRRLALSRAELRYLEAAAASAGLSLDPFLERILRAFLEAKKAMNHSAKGRQFTALSWCANVGPLVTSSGNPGSHDCHKKHASCQERTAGRDEFPRLFSGARQQTGDPSKVGRLAEQEQKG
jgi:hypothetical protein